MAFWLIVFSWPWAISLAIPAATALAIPNPIALQNAHSDYYISPILPQLETRDWTLAPRDSDLGLAALAGIFGMAPGPKSDVLKAVGDEVMPVINGQGTETETETTTNWEVESEWTHAAEETAGKNIIADMGDWKLLKRWWGSDSGSHGKATLQKRIPPKEGSPYLHCTGQRTAPLCCAMEKGEDVGCESPAARPNDVMDFIRLCGNFNQAARCCIVTIHGFTCEEPNGRLHYYPGQCDKYGLLGLCID